MLEAIDIRLFELINNQWKNLVFDLLMPTITQLDNFLLPLAAAWIWLFIKGDRTARWLLVLVLAAVGLSDVLSSHVLKPLIERARPCHELMDVHLFIFSCKNSWSMPSSHAVNIACAVTVLSHHYRRTIPVLLLAALLVGYSRVYVGLHYPGDVLVGWLVGILLGLLCAQVARKILKFKSWQGQEE